MTILASDIAALISSRAIRVDRKVSAVSRSKVTYRNFNPDLVRLDQASGGYNCVVQVAAYECLSVFQSEVKLSSLEVVLGPGQLKTLLQSQGAFDNSVLNQLGNYLDPTSVDTLDIYFNPNTLDFPSNGRVRITYGIDIFIKPGLFVRGLTPPRGVSRAPISPPGVAGTFDWSSILVGSFAIELECDYDFDTDPDFGTVDVYAEVSTAAITARISGADVRRIYDQVLSGPSSSFQQQLTLAKKVHIAPAYSLVGPNPSTDPVTEIDHFEVDVFHVDSLPRQALVIAINLTPLCQGTRATVQHFIGDEGYGLIVDEATVSRLIMNKWRMFMLPRSLPASAPVTMTRNGVDIDGTLYGTLALDTLDVVAIQPDANLGSDILLISGSATASVMYAQLSNGETVYPGQVDFGPSATEAWGVAVVLAIDENLSPVPEISDYQQSVQEGAFQYIAKPFLRAYMGTDLVHPSYCRLEGVLQQIMVVGGITGGWA